MRSPCSVDGCPWPLASHGYCQTHAKRIKRGLPLGYNRLAPVQERFWRFVAMGPNGCWLWSGQPNAGGYGTIRANKRTLLAHRVSYEINKGVIPDGLQVDHVCANRRCVNPDHLEAVTCAVNVQRAKARIVACPHGHAYDKANTKIDSRGARRCRTCDRDYSIRYKARVKAEAR